MFGVAVQGVGLPMLLAVPIAIFEMVFAGWLIVKGFDPAAIASAPAKPGRSEVLSPA
jgi:hypothetical protein